MAFSIAADIFFSMEDARRFHRTPGGVTLITTESLGQQLHFVR